MTSHDFAWIGISQVAVLASQEEAYREVLSRGDGVFLAAGPEETKSDYRRSMLRHQIAEDERKRCWDVNNLMCLIFVQLF